MSDPTRFFGPTVAAFDESVDELMERVRGHPVVDRAFYTASALGDWSLIWQLIGAVQALADDRRRPDAVRLGVTLGLESLLVNQGVKRLFHRQRPVFDAESGPVDLRVPVTSSFPSGHASAGFCAAVLLSQRQPRLAPLWFSLAAGVSASRVYVRMHHASDVVLGAALGAGLGVVVTRLVPLGPRR